MEIATAPKWGGFRIESHRAKNRSGICGCRGATYGMWFLAARLLPGIRPGMTLVVEAKYRYVTSHAVFEKESPIRLMIFGDSRVLSGFQPQLFDSLSGGRVESFNMGLPGIRGYVPTLARVLRQSVNRPTHVLITKPWEPSPPPWWMRLKDDEFINERVFPFKNLLRGLSAIMLIRGRTRGGFWNFYEEGLQNAGEILSPIVGTISSSRRACTPIIDCLTIFDSKPIRQIYRYNSSSPRILFTEIFYCNCGMNLSSRLFWFPCMSAKGSTARRRATQQFAPNCGTDGSRFRTRLPSI